jgi:uncharacterized protein YjdB
MLALMLAACGDNVATVKVEPAAATISAKDGTVLLKASPLDSKGEQVVNALTQIKWSSADANIATVDAGKIVAKKSGDVVITAAVGDVKGTAKVTVAIPAKLVIEPGGVEIEGVGKLVPVAGKATDELNRPIKESDLQIIWSTSDVSVATVEDGKIKSMGAGEATITGTVKALKANATVKVKLPPVAKVEITPPSAMVDKVNGQVQLKAIAHDAGGAPIAGVKTEWSSSNDKIAKVEGDGTVTIVKKGKAKIKATIGGQFAEAEVGAK